VGIRRSLPSEARCRRGAEETNVTGYGAVLVLLNPARTVSEEARPRRIHQVGLFSKPVIFRLLRGSAYANSLRNCRNRPAWTPEHPGNCNDLRGGRLVLARGHPLAPLARVTSAALISTALAGLRTSTFGRQ
jgi:hypothetical protein